MSGPVWFGAYLAAVMLRAAAGMAKALRPSGTARALSLLGVTIPTWAVRAAATVEVALSGWGVVRGGAAAAVLVACSYLGFFVFVMAALVRHTPLSSCGCFGESEAPPTATHAVLNAGAALVACAAALGYHPSFAHAVQTQPAGGVPFAVLAATAAYLGYLAMAVLPRASAAAKALR